MRRRAAAFIVLLGIAVVAAVAATAAPGASSLLHVAVSPQSGSQTTRFAVSFRVPGPAARPGPSVDLYRITASGPKRAGCQSGAATTTRAAPGTSVHARLSPARASVWCAGTYRGQVWDRLIPPCPVREACPAILPLPRLVGKFTFRVVRPLAITSGPAGVSPPVAASSFTHVPRARSLTASLPRTASHPSGLERTCVRS